MALQGLTAKELFEQLPDPALLLKVDGTVIEGNELAVELFEVASPFPAINVIELLPQPERARLNPLAWMEKWAASPHAPELDYVYLTCRTKQANERQLGVRVARIVTDATYYLVTLRDISVSEARLRAERQSHRIMARVLAISADAVITTDDAFSVTSLNASAEKLFGYEPGEIIGNPLNMLLPGRFRTSHEQHMRDFSHDESSSRLMGTRALILGLAKDGTEVPLEASITRVTVENRTVFSAHLRDVRQRLATTAALEESQAQFRELFEHVDQPMAMLTAEGTTIDMNPAAQRLLSNTQDVIGQAFAQLPWWSKDSNTADALNQALRACRDGEVFRTQTTMHFEGREHRFDVTMRPISRSGKVFSILVDAHEIDA